MIEVLFNPFNLSILLFVLGDIIVERSGIINLAIDGAIALFISVAFILTQRYGPINSLLYTSLIAIALALLISLLINVLHSSHILTGLSLNIALYGLSAYIGTQFQIGTTIGKTVRLSTWQILLISIGVTLAVWWFLYRTRIGIAIRACGYNPRAADHIGVRVWLYRTVALVIGYIVIAIGAYIHIVIYRGGWRAYTGIGLGFVSLALAMASTWHPLLGLPISILFGYMYTSLYGLQIRYGIPSPILDMAPFIASIAIVTIIMVTPLGKKLGMPKALGEIYFKEERAV
ncbi:inner-membrane translocator [Ignisphaera aggregans DSM 17230]|uniref:Inner-membrane translocator n=1 Tax=Ignisphaera aggregans (strain DSM 17230 / JCM 13409 / AQ1.S1) TaxID=583356 RepID=E0SRG2_IGNAA|nr:inner-membrane translocator [Ignisphaera aggregans DSM 17230]